MKKNLKSVISLTAICAVVALLLSLTNQITAPIIEKAENSAVNEALAVVLPDGEDFELLDVEPELPASITEVYSAKNGGYVFKMSVTGYASGLVVLCGINADGTVAGATCISSNETNGAENSYGEKFVGKTSENVDSVDTVSGSTKTTNAYKSAIKDALNAAVILGGGSVDLRSEEEILQDNLKSALPEGDTFTSVFLTEKLEKVSAVYSADNGTGYVAVCGENYIGVGSGFNVITNIAADIGAVVSSDLKKQINSVSQEIDITKYENMPTAVEKAYKTSSGNFVFELKAAGFGITGDEWYKPSGEYIKIKVSATADGEIIACKTVSQAETDGIGSACAEESFYSQFDGKTESNYTEIDAISGATKTTNGYKTAISKVFEAVKILKGEF